MTGTMPRDTAACTSPKCWLLFAKETTTISKVSTHFPFKHHSNLIWISFKFHQNYFQTSFKLFTDSIFMLKRSISYKILENNFPYSISKKTQRGTPPRNRPPRHHHQSTVQFPRVRPRRRSETKGPRIRRINAKNASKGGIGPATQRTSLHIEKSRHVVRQALQEAEERSRQWMLR